MKRAFTLIEMLVVIVIIVLLMTAVVAVGTQVRASANRRATLAELKTLDGLMQDYLAKGNPEPGVIATTNNPSQWPYNTSSNSVNAFTQWWPTTPPSDPFNWVTALQSDPEIAKKLANLRTITDADLVTDPPAPAPINPLRNPNLVQPIPIRTLIVDAYGSPIRYIPSTANTPGKFVSAGPDAKFSNSISLSGWTATTAVRTDEIYSTDPQ